MSKLNELSYKELIDAINIKLHDIQNEGYAVSEFVELANRYTTTRARLNEATELNEKLTNELEGAMNYKKALRLLVLPDKVFIVDSINKRPKGMAKIVIYADDERVVNGIKNLFPDHN